MNTSNLPNLSPSAVEGLRALLTIIESGLASAPPLPIAPRRTIQEAGNEFLVSKARTGKSVRYLIEMRNSLSYLFKGRMLRPIHTITADEIERWSHVGKSGARTRRNLISNAKILYSFARSRGYVSENPAAAVELPPLDDSPVQIQTPNEVRTVLNAAQKIDQNIMRFLAVQYFAGLRTSEASRLTESEIGARYIEIKAEKCKTRRRRIVAISPTLRAWLNVGGQLPVESLWRKLVSVKRASGVKFPTNAARHSFCSYHLAHFENAAKTALQAGHSEVMLFRHYREVVTPEDAEVFWSITPEKM